MTTVPAVRLPSQSDVEPVGAAGGSLEQAGDQAGLEDTFVFHNLVFVKLMNTLYVSINLTG